MLTEWSAVACVVLLASAAIFLLVRRAPSEIEPTVRAFDELRSALRPEIAGLRSENEKLRARSARLRGPGDLDSRR